MINIKRFDQFKKSYRIIPNKRSLLPIISTSPFFNTNYSVCKNRLRFGMTSYIKYSFSESKVNSEVRKLLEICQSAIPNLLQEGDSSAAIQFINQIVLVLASSLFDSDKSQSKKVLNYLFGVLQQIRQMLSEEQGEKVLQVFKVLSAHIEKINQIGFIIRADQLYLAYVQKFKGKQNATYIEIISKLAQNCIIAQKYDLALQCLKQADKIRMQFDIQVAIDTQVQNLINFGITFLSMGMIDQSISAYKKALKLCQQIDLQGNNLNYRIAVFECLGDIQKDRNLPQPALQYYQSALKLIQNSPLGTTIHSLVLLFKIAETSFNLQRYQNTVKNCKEIESKLHQDSSFKEQFEFQNQVIVLMAQSYRQLQNREKSILCFQQYITNIQKSIILDQQMYSKILRKLITLYQESERYQKCLEYLKSLNKYYKRQGKESEQEQCSNKIKSIESSIKTR